MQNVAINTDTVQMYLKTTVQANHWSTFAQNGIIHRGVEQSLWLRAKCVTWPHTLIYGGTMTFLRNTMCQMSGGQWRYSETRCAKCLGDNDVTPKHGMPNVWGTMTLLRNTVCQCSTKCSSSSLTSNTRTKGCQILSLCWVFFRRGPWRKLKREGDKSGVLCGQAQTVEPTDCQRSYRIKLIVQSMLGVFLVGSEEKGSRKAIRNTGKW
jgi:hypothetical protein